MAEGASVSRKEKKAQRDAERHKGSKKRKREEDVETETREHELQQDFIPLSGDPVREAEVEAELRAKARADVTRRKDIKPPKSTKRREGNKAVGGDGIEQPKSKKRRKENIPTGQAEEERDGGETSTNANKSRFILFIGNLPYNTTDASLQNYFKSIAPFKLRHRTDPKTKKSKGFAFLEFENFDRMQTCIKLFHHSLFNPELHSGSSTSNGTAAAKKDGKDRGARKINVELTAGGGGSKEGRMEKIKAKNVKLDEQRKRRAEAERKEKEKQRLKEEKEGLKGKDGGARKKKGQDGVAGSAVKPEQQTHARRDEDTAQVHPSRLARVTG